MKKIKKNQNTLPPSGWLPGSLLVLLQRRQQNTSFVKKTITNALFVKKTRINFPSVKKTNVIFPFARKASTHFSFVVWLNAFQRISFASLMYATGIGACLIHKDLLVYSLWSQ